MRAAEDAAGTAMSGWKGGAGMADGRVEEFVVPPYRVSSQLYDRMVGEVLHQVWRENFERLERRYGLGLDLVADVACGTGLVSEYLAGRGCRVYAVDGSPYMLRVAAGRLRGRKGVLLMRQDMRFLSLPSLVSTLVCATDSLNHLLEEEHLRRAVFSFAGALREGGFLLFDVNTLHQLREGADEQEWNFELERWNLTWKSRWDEVSSTAVLTMRMEEREGTVVRRWVEVHRERAYPCSFLVSVLREAGFRGVDVWDAAGLGKPGPGTRRLQFVAWRGGG